MTTAYTRRLIIVVRAEHRDAANTIAARVDTVGGSRTFTVPLYPAGLPQVTPTHYWCNWVMTERDRTALLARFGSDTLASPGTVYDVDAGWTPGTALAAQGLVTRNPA